MKRFELKSHLRPYSISGRRTTTINHAFASAIARFDTYDDEFDQLVVKALSELGYDPDADLICVYCQKNPAETWDHVYALVEDSKYSGYGHTLGNLLPSCKNCNSSKGNKDWTVFLEQLIVDPEERHEREALLKRYLEQYGGKRFGTEDITELCKSDMEQLEQIHKEILSLMKQADKLSEKIRQKVKAHLQV